MNSPLDDGSVREAVTGLRVLVALVLVGVGALALVAILGMTGVLA